MEYTLDSLYGHINSELVFGPWQQRFAWRPVKMLYWYTDDLFTVDCPIKMGKLVWWQPLVRRRITWHEGWAEYKLTYQRWQYTTFEELMRWGKM